jgi:hypothetical protein
MDTVPDRELRLRGGWHYGLSYDSANFWMRGGMTTKFLGLETNHGVSSNVAFQFECEPVSGIISGGPSGGGVVRDGPVAGGIAFEYRINDTAGGDLHTVDITADSRLAGGGTYAVGGGVEPLRDSS